MGDLAWLPISHHQVSLVIEDRLDKTGYVFLRILVIAIGVDYDICAKTEGSVQPGLKCDRKAFVANVTNDVVNPEIPSDLDRTIG